MRRIFLALAGVLSFSSIVRASVPVTTRLDWISADGTDSFHSDQGGRGTWTESLTGGSTYHFTLIAHEAAYVQLYDASRDIHVWLYPTSFFLATGSATPQVFRYGHWDDRRLFSYRDAHNNIAYFDLYPGRVWRWASDGVITEARETLRNDDQIQVYDGDRRLTFSLADTQVWMKPDGGSWSKLADGAWD